MIEYENVLKELPPHVRRGRFAMFAFESVSRVTSWELEQADLIFEEVVKTKDLSVSAWIKKYSLDRQQCIDGVGFWLELRRVAEEIALEIILRWLERDGLDIAKLPTNHNYVDWALFAESEEDEALWDIRTNDPLLFGEICIETERITNAFVSGELRQN